MFDIAIKHLLFKDIFSSFRCRHCKSEFNSMVWMVFRWETKFVLAWHVDWMLNIFFSFPVQLLEAVKPPPLKLWSGWAPVRQVWSWWDSTTPIHFSNTTPPKTKPQLMTSRTRRPKTWLVWSSKLAWSPSSLTTQGTRFRWTPQGLRSDCSTTTLSSRFVEIKTSVSKDATLSLLSRLWSFFFCLSQPPVVPEI